MLDAFDGLFQRRTPVEVLLDAQVVIRQVANGADAKILSSLRRFHGLDLGQLHMWKKANGVMLGWWRGTCRGFITDSKTKSKPGDHDDPKTNHFFLLRNFGELDGLEAESERVDDLA